MLLSLLLFTTAASGKESELIQFFKQWQTLQADFEQVVFDQSNRQIQRQEGQIYLQRPGQFRWDYQSPYEQQIIADGSKIWIYDIDLEQVTAKAQALTVGNTPAQLLSDPDALKNNFHITAANRDEESKLTWFELTPRDPDSTFEMIRIALSRDGLHTLELHDSFGQTTRMQFDNLQLDLKLDPLLFHFIPPEGVDLIDETE